MLKGGIVGFGRMGVTHYAILNTHPDVRINTVCDTSGFITSNLKRYSDVAIHDSYESMLEREELDFVVVCTPPDSHAAVAVDAAQRGLHVFMEKPFTLSLADGRRACEAAQTAGIVNQVGYFLRFNDVFREVKTLLDAGALGTPLHYRNEMIGRTVIRAWNESWRMNRSKGGGCLLDFGSHCIDLADYLFGAPASLRGCRLQTIYSKDVDDAVYATAEYDNGLVGNLIVNWSDETHRRPFNRLELLATGGKVVADRQSLRVYLKKEHPACGRFRSGWNSFDLPELARPIRYELRGLEYTAQLDHFIDCISDRGRTNECTFADGLRTDDVVERIRADAAAGEG
ncbi:MAG: oxidoreductase [Planctomycetes bacterium]|nr:oxidoreductase [Planctomycetota bacterium]